VSSQELELKETVHLDPDHKNFAILRHHLHHLDDWTVQSRLRLHRLR
jgi:hypothetical protein